MERVDQLSREQMRADLPAFRPGDTVEVHVRIVEGDKERKSYDRQFKIDAVSLVVNGGRSVLEVARDLGIDANVLYRWK